MEAYAVATGHNLDDTLATLLQAYVRGDVAQLAKLRPVLPPSEGLVARVRPLIETPEEDLRLYVEPLGIEHAKAKCPYSQGATSFTYKAALELLEQEHPSVKFQMLRSFLDKLQPLISNCAISEQAGRKCAICGEPSTSAICQFCRIRNQILRENFRINKNVW